MVSSYKQKTQTRKKAISVEKQLEGRHLMKQNKKCVWRSRTTSVIERVGSQLGNNASGKVVDL